jgi:hypothetical protein
MLRRLDELALERRDAFNAMIAKLSKGRERDIDWWVTWTATRNTHVSKLFAQLVQLSLVEELERGGAQLEILTDNGAFARVLNKANSRIVHRRPHVRGWKTTLHNIFSSLRNSVAAHVAARLTGREETVPRKPFLIVEEGINETSFAGSDKIDHYYPALAGQLSPADVETLYTMPVFYRVKSYWKVFALIRASKTPFLVREDYLSLSDYVFAFGHWFRARRFLGNDELFAGFPIGELIDADLREGRFTNAVLQALLSYRFWRNARGRGLQVAKLLDWYEGHDRDHATAAAINWHALSIRHVAYRHMTGPQYLGAIPAQHEVDAGVVPRHFAIVGRRAAAELEENVRGLDVYSVPSLRFARLGEVSRQSRSGPLRLLVLLGLEESFLRSVSAMLTPAFTAPELRDVIWMLRPHPLSPPSIIERAFPGLPSHARFSTGDFRSDLAQADIVLGIATNALIEALVTGVPVITLASGNTPIENPIPLWIDPRLSRMCYEVCELAPLISAMARQASAQEDDAALRVDLVGDIEAPGLRAALG